MKPKRYRLLGSQSIGAAMVGQADERNGFSSGALSSQVPLGEHLGRMMLSKSPRGFGELNEIVNLV